MLLNTEILEGDSKLITRKLNNEYRKRSVEKKEERYRMKKVQSNFWVNQKAPAFKWMQRNIMPEKVASIIEMCESMVDTRVHLAVTGRLPNNETKCKLCGKIDETLQHWLSGCEFLCGTEYVERHHKALMVFAHQWAMQEELIEKGCWYKEKWIKGKVIENGTRRLRWDYEYNMTVVPVEHRRPDLVLEFMDQKEMYILDMACPQEPNVEKKRKSEDKKVSTISF